MSEIYRYIKKSAKKLLIDRNSKRLLQLKFRSNHSIKSKCSKFIVKKILPSILNMQTYCLSCEDTQLMLVQKNNNDKKSN